MGPEGWGPVSEPRWAAQSDPGWAALGRAAEAEANPSLKARGDTRGSPAFLRAEPGNKSWKVHLGVVFKTLFVRTD